MSWHRCLSPSLLLGGLFVTACAPQEPTEIVTSRVRVASATGYLSSPLRGSRDEREMARVDTLLLR